MTRTSLDGALRVTAVVLGCAALLVVAANPQLHTDSDARARNPLSSKELRQRDAAAKTRGYTFLLKSSEHRYPGRWCGGEIRYTIDMTELPGEGLDPAGEQQRWADVMHQWSQASRGVYTFTYTGSHPVRTRDDGSLDLDFIEPGTIAISYVHGNGEGEGDHDATAVKGRTAGNGGLQVVSNGPDDAGALVGDRGFVMIDVDDAAALGGDALRQALYQHESGHALGLGHVGSATSIMNGTLSNTRLQLAEGDIAGVQALTRMPCERD